MSGKYSCESCNDDGDKIGMVVGMILVLLR